MNNNCQHGKLSIEICPLCVDIAPTILQSPTALSNNYPHIKMREKPPRSDKSDVGLDIKLSTIPRESSTSPIMSKETNYMQKGDTLECSHCNPEKYEAIPGWIRIACECNCHKDTPSTTVSETCECKAWNKDVCICGGYPGTHSPTPTVSEEKCYSCGGKGTYSQIHGLHGAEDFGGDGFDTVPKIYKHLCTACNGTGLKPKAVVSEEIRSEGQSWEERWNRDQVEFAKKGYNRSKEITTGHYELGYDDCHLRARDFMADILKEREEKHNQVYLWLLGYNDFPLKPEGGPAYWWRSKLREKLESLGISLSDRGDK